MKNALKLFALISSLMFVELTNAGCCRILYNDETGNLQRVYETASDAAECKAKAQEIGGSNAMSMWSPAPNGNDDRCPHG